MKTPLLLTTFLITSLFFSTNKVKACTDYHPPALGITCEYDAAFTEINIRVWGMQLFGSPAGPFCTCAISNWTNIFSSIDYVAFVDSGTTNVISGFAPWTPNSTASSAWDSYQFGGWDAFLAESIGPGLANGAPVELYIRASLPAGYNFNQLDTSLALTALGTDEYDNTSSFLALTHNSISYFSNALNGINYIVQPLSYFTNLDNIITGIENKSGIDNTLNIYPNPFKDNLTIELNLIEQTYVEIFVTDLLGNIISQINNKKLNVGNNKLQWQAENISSGIYLLNVKTNNSLQVKKLVLNK